MIIQFPKPKEDVRSQLQDYYRISESFTRREYERFWTDQQERNTELWQVWSNLTA